VGRDRFVAEQLEYSIQEVWGNRPRSIGATW